MSLFAAPGHKRGGKIRGKGEAPRGGEIEVEGGGVERIFFVSAQKIERPGGKRGGLFSYFLLKILFWPPRLVTAKAKMEKKWNLFLGGARH